MLKVQIYGSVSSIEQHRELKLKILINDSDLLRVIQ